MISARKVKLMEHLGVVSAIAGTLLVLGIIASTAAYFVYKAMS